MDRMLAGFTLEQVECLWINIDPFYLRDDVASQYTASRVFNKKYFWRDFFDSFELNMRKIQGVWLDG